MLGRDDDVAGEHQLESAAERESVDRRDDRLEAVHSAGQSAEAAGHSAPQLAHMFGAVLGLELQVVARAERLVAGAGHNRHPLVRVVLEGVEHLFHFPHRVGMQGVHDPRAIDRHGGDVVGGRYLDELVAHGIPLQFDGVHAPLAGSAPYRHLTAISGMLGSLADDFLSNDPCAKIPYELAAAALADAIRLDSRTAAAPPPPPARLQVTPPFVESSGARHPRAVAAHRRGRVTGRQ